MEEIKAFIVDYIQREYTLPADVDVMNLNYVECSPTKNSKAPT